MQHEFERLSNEDDNKGDDKFEDTGGNALDECYNDDSFDDEADATIL